ncbi:MAG TPA: flagellar biosynthetic protein FliR [Nitrospiraceae bacterium]|jgi:flagellar biosynthetic protein FliR|nr:flagellar biosynthetic protein FliR [Nitrospiraceae bacterium]
MTSPMQWAVPEIHSFLALLFRVSGIIAALPLVGSRTVPVQIKIALSVTTSMVLAPVVKPLKMPADPTLLAAGVAGELVVGLAIGLASRLVFAALEIAGELMGVQMGFGVVQLLDPLAAHHAPLLGNLQTIMASLTFLSFDAHIEFLRAIAQSFESIPPFGAGLSPGLVEDFLRLSHNMFLVALKVAAPVLATVVLVNIALAVLGRAVAQMNVLALSFPATIAAGLLMMGLALPHAQVLYQREVIGLGETIRGLLKVLGHG